LDKRISGYLLRSVDVITGGLAKIAMVAMLVLIGWVTICVVMRFIFRNPISMGMEVGMVLAMFVYLFPLAFGLKERVHPRMLLFIRKMSQRWQSLVQLFNLLVMVGLGSLYTFYFWQSMLKELLRYKTGLVTIPYLNMGHIRIIMVIGMGAFVLLAISHLGLTLRDVIRGRSSKTGPDVKITS